MRKIAANYIITGTGDILKNSYIELTEEGEIVKIVDTKGGFARNCSIRIL